MQFIDNILGRTEPVAARRFWRQILMIGLGVCGVGGVGSQFWENVYWLNLDMPLVLALVALSGAVMAGMTLSTSRPEPIVGRYEFGAVVVAGLLLLGHVLNSVNDYAWSGGDWFAGVIPRLALVAVWVSMAALLPRIAAERSLLAGWKSGASQPEKLAAPASENTLYVALGGAVAVVLSLLVLPWFRVDVGPFDGSISFNDLRDLYNYARDNGFDSDVRFYFLEWGYIVSYLVSGIAVFMAMKTRDLGRSFEGAGPKVAIAVTGLMGLWQTVLATALTSLDDDGSVQIGAWLGVAGHVALVVAFVMASRPRPAPATTS